ncbi:4-hydroxy-tetrahydrodipicolinate synthase [Cohnella zeiphila]|uniref:4-hydroxy-tetrahydrodipicolinate synthase n=1 Tax=Cohnella zeiphila TaxID=2761120 RepID=A0A7X0SX08_9BACL|nr:4-hydroxy-tetrahydrodipicolinate synthase [Cohnella zeiphila]MBB6735483.1 4-hydroxy-tetrahydrodipicolinate synthase [Cohnella zeiphila]
MSFGRLITAMVTPFNEQLEIDWEVTGRLVDYLIEEQKSDSLVVSGTTGESPTLTDDEKEALFRFTVQRAAGRCKIIAGTGSNDTAHSIHLTRIAEQAGVDGILLVTPYYNKPNQEGMYRHFKAIAESTSLPVILYNVPGRTGVNLSAATTLRLAELPNVAATKECSTLDQMTEIIKDAPEGFLLYCGDDAVNLPVLSIGGYGLISVASHVIGAEMKELIAAALEGRREDAVRLNNRCFPVFKGLFQCPHPVPNPVAVKYALTLKGLPVGDVRPPLAGPSEEEAAFIRKLLG